MKVSQDKLAELILGTKVAARACEKLEEVTGISKEIWAEKFLAEIMDEVLDSNYVQEFVESTTEIAP